ncbi:MAG: hypothetical protein ACKOI2_06715 [Actinomycetota bacterium]
MTACVLVDEIDDGSFVARKFLAASLNSGTSAGWQRSVALIPEYADSLKPNILVVEELTYSKPPLRRRRNAMASSSVSNR